MTQDHIIVLYLVGIFFGLRILAEVICRKFKESRYYRRWMSRAVAVLFLGVLAYFSILIISNYPNK